MISKKKITHATNSATPKAILTKLHVQPERLYLQLVFFALDIIHGDRCYRKTPKTIILF